MGERGWGGRGRREGGEGTWGREGGWGRDGGWGGRVGSEVGEGRGGEGGMTVIDIGMFNSNPIQYLNNNLT